jgi:hypothetical protein
VTLSRIIDLIVVPAMAADTNLTAADIRTYLYLRSHPSTSLRGASAQAGLPRETFRRSVKHLLKQGWAFRGVGVEGGPTIVVAWMPPEVELLVAAELGKVRNEIVNVGEWLMKNILDMIIGDPNFHDNARPSWLAAMDGGGRLEMDRWYRLLKLVVEFHGRQHFGISDFAPTDEELSRQIMRDDAKAGMCAREGITLIEVSTADLSYVKMVDKLTTLAPAVPVLPVKQDGAVFKTLRRLCAAYIAHAAREDKKRRSRQ